MEKIPTLFVRDENDRRYVTENVTPGCEWVLQGEGTPTRKYDGTCVKLDDAGEWWARREVKAGKEPPANYRPLSTDPNTGKTVGWEPVGQSSFAKFHAEAVSGLDGRPGTYELVGPKINGNPERRERHELIPHAGAEAVTVEALTFDGIRRTVRAEADQRGAEGIVWHHPDGRMVKIKARDFPR